MAIEDIHLAEFNRCRDEIDSRTEISERLVLGQITVLGLAISLPARWPLLERMPEVLLGLSAVSSFLWLFWLAHTRQISKLAAYIAFRLVPQIRDLPDATRTNEWALGWEEYTRVMDSAGPEGYRLPYPPSLEEAEIPPLNAATWKFLFFIGATPVLWLIYGIILWEHKNDFFKFTKEFVPYVRIFVMIAASTLWGLAIKEYCSIYQLWTAIDRQIVDSVRQKIRKA